ncbi:MAG: hypothetical protein M1829_006129 [Trizodia sp. TS-e1964]|nr:MAG: hypothetical protein M1829_006129 [Trizodia sp. TS-e1964]
MAANSGSSPMGNTPKTMSSRLLTMKFMRHAVALTPDTSESGRPHSKRQKTNAYSAVIIDQQAVQEALAIEEAKRDEALERQAGALGETKWALSFRDPNVEGMDHRPLKVSYAGFASIDDTLARPSAEEVVVSQGRRIFGGFNNSTPKRNLSDVESSPSEEDDDASPEIGPANDEDSDDETGVNALIRDSRQLALKQDKAARKLKRKAEREKIESEQKASSVKPRPAKKIKLSKLHSISDTKTPINTNIQCYNCGGRGHVSRDCDRKTKERSSKFQ